MTRNQNGRQQMKIRESGMPDEPYWDSFFNPTCIVTKLDCTGPCGDVVEFGCGYGTFTIPAAQAVSGRVTALDIEREMIAVTREKARTARLTNVYAVVRDFAAEGSGLPECRAGY